MYLRDYSSYVLYYSMNKYYLNEIEHQDAGTFTNIPFDNEIKYPITTILADAFVKKAYELKSINF